MPIIVVTGKEIEKIKGDFESYLNGMNMVGEISYSQYSELYDEGTKQIQKAYELGKSELGKENAELTEQNTSLLTSVENLNKSVQELEKENAELKNKLEHRNCLDCSNHSSNLRMRTLELEKECTKAKELLRYYFDCFKNDNKYTLSDFEVVEDTEQFLNSEVEK